MKVSIMTDRKERHFKRLGLYCSKKGMDISYKVLDFKENVNDVVDGELSKRPDLLITYLEDSNLANKEGDYFSNMHNLLTDPSQYRLKIEHQRVGKDQNSDNEKLIDKIEKYYKRAKRQGIVK